MRWWPRQQRAQYSALPLAERQDFNNASHGLSFRKRDAVPTILYIALFSLILISVSLAHYAARTLDIDPFRTANSQPGAFEIHRPPAEAGSFNASALLHAQTDGLRTFSPPGVGCQLDAWHNARYSSLASSSESLGILLALNLIDAQSILPNLLVQLPELLRFLGPHNVHVSVYENGSGDLTQKLLLARKHCSLDYIVAAAPRTDGNSWPHPMLSRSGS